MTDATELTVKDAEIARLEAECERLEDALDKIICPTTCTSLYTAVQIAKDVRP